MRRIPILVQNVRNMRSFFYISQISSLLVDIAMAPDFRLFITSSLSIISPPVMTGTLVLLVNIFVTFGIIPGNISTALGFIDLIEYIPVFKDRWSNTKNLCITNISRF